MDSNLSLANSGPARGQKARNNANPEKKSLPTVQKQADSGPARVQKAETTPTRTKKAYSQYKNRPTYVPPVVTRQDDTNPKINKRPVCCPW